MRKRTRWLPLLFALLACAAVGLLASCGDEDDDDTAGTHERARSQAVGLADTFMADVQAEDNSWSWGDGTLMLGLMHLEDRTGQRRFAEYVRRFVDYHLATGYVLATSDQSLSVRAAIWLYERTGDPRYLEPVERFDRYIFEEVRRTSDGGINHLGWASGSSLWMDSLFMVGPLLLDRYEQTGDERFVNEIRDQILIFASHLRDPELHLWYHRWDDEAQARTPEAPEFWGRGNGWVMYTMAEFLLRAPQAIEGYDQIAEYFRTQAEAVAAWQQADGLWSTVVNHPDESYRELSCGALFAASFARGARLGLLDDSYLDRAERAMAAIGDRVFVDGRGRMRMPRVSLGTSPGTLPYYNQIIVSENVNYGIGAYLLAIDELMADGEFPDSVVSITEPTCEGLEGNVACGIEALREGALSDADQAFADAVPYDPLDPRIAWGRGFVAAADTVMDVLEQLDRLSVGDVSTEEFDVYLKTDVRAGLHEAIYQLETVDSEAELAFYLDRLLILENGTSIGIGTVDWDLGEALAVRGVLRALSGALGVMDALDITVPLDLLGIETMADDAKSGRLADEIEGTKGLGGPGLASSLRELADGLDDVAWALFHVTQETDDQADDLISQDLIALDGDLVVPGVMLPVSVKPLIADLLGMTPEQVDALDMPDAAIDVLRIVEAACRTLADVVD